MVYELLTGENPFMGTSAEDIVHKQLTVTAKPLTSYNKLIPIRTEQIVQKMLEKDPDKRASDMNIVITELLHAHQKTKVIPRKV
jgi:serine/threonine protein kinase